MANLAGEIQGFEHWQRSAFAAAQLYGPFRSNGRLLACWQYLGKGLAASPPRVTDRPPAALQIEIVSLLTQWGGLRTNRLRQFLTERGWDLKGSRITAALHALEAQGEVRQAINNFWYLKAHKAVQDPKRLKARAIAKRKCARSRKTAKAVALYQQSKNLTDIAVALGYERGHGQCHVKQMLIKAGAIQPAKGAK